MIENCAEERKNRKISQGGRGQVSDTVIRFFFLLLLSMESLEADEICLRPETKKEEKRIMMKRQKELLLLR